MDDSDRLINHLSSKTNVSVNANENVKLISNPNNADSIHKYTSRQITKRRITKATYAFLF